MSINVELKEFFKFFQKVSFRIAFLIGAIVLKIFSLSYSNGIICIIIDTILVLAIIFLVDDLFSRLGKIVSKCIDHHRIIISLKELNRSQVLTLISHYFDFSKNDLKICQIGYFVLSDGLYSTLTSANIIVQTIAGNQMSYPFMMLAWVYDELNNAIKNKDIEIEFKNNQTEVKWYKRHFKYDKQELNKDEYI